MLLLKKLSLSNFLSHENTELEFKPTSQLLVDGDSGAGKSSVIDGIVWALYGKARVDNKSLVRRGAKKAEVTLDLDNEGKHIRLVRSVTAAGKHALEIFDVDSKGVAEASNLMRLKEQQEWVEKELTGASYTLFINSAVYLQDQTGAFVSMSAAERRDLLLELAKAEDFTSKYEQVREFINVLKNNHSNDEGRAEVWRTQLSRIEQEIAMQTASLPNKNDIESGLSTATKVRDEVSEKLNAAKATQASYVPLQKQVESTRHLLENATAQVIEYEALLKKEEDTQRALSLIPAETPDMSEALQAIDAHELKKPFCVVTKAQIDALQKKVAIRAEEVEKAPKCPAGDNCPHTHVYNERLTEALSDLQLLATREASELASLKQWEDEGTALKAALAPDGVDVLRRNIGEAQRNNDQRAKLKGSLETIIEQKGTTDVTVLNAKVAEIRKAHDEAQKALSGIDQMTTTTQIAQYTQELSDANSAFQHYERERAGYDAKVSFIKNKEEEKKEIAAEIERYTKEVLPGYEKKLAQMELLKSAFSPSGVKTIIIDYLLPRLEEQVNDILERLSDFSVHIDTQRSSSDGKSTVEGIFITISNDQGEEMPFEAYSGGEKLKIMVAFSEALAALQKTGFRIFDEVFVGLDENSTDSFAEVLHTLQNRFGQILCISHLRQIKDLFETQVVVRKHNGISYVE